MNSEHKTQIIIALIGLVGTVAVGVIANLDKLSSEENTGIAGELRPDDLMSGSNNMVAVQDEVNEDLPNGYIRTQFDGRVGKVAVNNTSAYEFKVTLWHPDSEAIFGTWVVSGASEEYLKTNDQPFSVGNDWGVQIGDSEIKSIGGASRWQGNEWRISQSSFFE